MNYLSILFLSLMMSFGCGCGVKQPIYDVPAMCVKVVQDPILLRGLRDKESTNNSQAVNKKSKASGAYQFLPSTYRGLGYTKEDIHDPIKSTQIADEYLTTLIDDNNGNIQKALAEYYGGAKWKHLKVSKNYANDVLRRYENFKSDPYEVENKKLWEATGYTCSFPD